MSTIEHIHDDRPKKWAKAAVIIFAEAVVFGIGLELSKELYKLIRRRRDDEETPPPPDEADEPGEST